jgi:hypothetical protein
MIGDRQTFHAQLAGALNKGPDTTQAVEQTKLRVHVKVSEQ